MPIDPNKIFQNIRRSAGLEDGSHDLFQEPLIQEDDIEAEREPLIESAGDYCSRPVSVCFAGVGTCGVNMLMTFKEDNIINNPLVEFIGINSDGDSINELEKLGFDKNILLKQSDGSNSLGAGGDPEVAKQMGEEHYKDFVKYFKNKDLVLVVTGMGGGTGTGAAPYVAKAAKEAQGNKRNTLTIGVTSMPAGYEADRYDLAESGLNELRQYVDAIVVIDQMHILDVLEETDASAEDVDALVDSHFQIVLQSILDTVTTYTKRNIDFADVCSTLKHCGDAIITTVETSSGNIDDVKKELEKAINDKLLIDHTNKVASRLLVYHFFEKGYSERKHYEVVGEIQRLFGWTKDPRGFYRCLNLPDDITLFQKIAGDPNELYAGRNKVIIMAGGFQDAPPKIQMQLPPATQRTQAAPPQPAQTQTQPAVEHPPVQPQPQAQLHVAPPPAHHSAHSQQTQTQQTQHHQTHHHQTHHHQTQAVPVYTPPPQPTQAMPVYTQPAPPPQTAPVYQPPQPTQAMPVYTQPTPQTQVLHVPPQAPRKPSFEELLKGMESL